MRNTLTRFRALALTGAIATTPACLDTTYVAEGGIGGTGISSGPISGFGSVIVNGVRFDTRDATILIDGRTATEEELQVGMVVTVEGSIEEGRAERIEFNPTLRGTIEAIDGAARTFEVMGQRVIVDDLTLFSGPGFETLAVGDFVTVSTVGEGSLRTARYVEVARNLRLPPPVVGEQGQFENGSGNPEPVSLLVVEGRISALDRAARTFSIGTQRVDYGNTAALPEEGQRARVAGALNGEGVLIASRIELAPACHPGQEGDTLLLRGPLAAASPSAIELNGCGVALTEATRFVDGSADELTTGRSVVVEARFGAAGALRAERVTLLPQAQLKLRGEVVSIDADEKIVEVAGQRLRLLPTTLLRDLSVAALRTFSLADLQPGDAVALVAARRGGEWVVLRLERHETLLSTILESEVTDPVRYGQPFTIAGITVEPDRKMAVVDASGAALAWGEEPTTLPAGSHIRVEGQLKGTTLTAFRLVVLELAEGEGYFR